MNMPSERFKRAVAGLGLSAAAFLGASQAAVQPTVEFYFCEEKIATTEAQYEAMRQAIGLLDGEDVDPCFADLLLSGENK